MPVFDTPGKVALKIGLGGGHVSVETDDVEETTVEVEALRDDEVTREAIAAMRIEARDRGGFHEVVVEAPKRSQGWLGALGRGPEDRRPRSLPARCRPASQHQLGGHRGRRPPRRRRGEHRVGRRVARERHGLTQGEHRERRRLGARDRRLRRDQDRLRRRPRAARARARCPPTSSRATSSSGRRSTDISIATVSGDQEIAALRGGEHAKVQSVRRRPGRRRARA